MVRATQMHLSVISQRLNEVLAIDGSETMLGPLLENSVPHATPLIKTTTESITSDDTLSSDAALQFAVLANEDYRFRFVIFYETAAAADFKYTVDGPSSPTLVRIFHRSVAPAATAFGGILTETAFGFTAVAITAASATAGVIFIDGVLHNGANAGTVAFQWAQNTNNGGTTEVLKGSYVEYSLA